MGTLQRLFALGGFLLGLVAAYYSLGLLSAVFPDSWIPLAVLIAAPLAAGAFLYLLAPTLIFRTSQFASWIEGRLSRAPVHDVLFGSVGLILGLVIANLIRGSLVGIPIVGTLLPLLAALLFGYLGWTVAVKKREDLLALVQGLRPARGDKEAKAPEQPAGSIKLLDTSAIIDGRIADVCETGFLEGVLVVPDFVLDELRHIADSSDPLRRNRGRRGLEVLERLQAHERVPVKIMEDPASADMEVDRRLVEMARRLGAAVFTTDYNLNKVARLHGVETLNLNELGNALKPVVLPGEELELQIIRNGKEAGQGIGYLDDGTMVVVEGGRQYVGSALKVIVTSVIQTAAGRMIFARQRESLEPSTMSHAKA
ncbi:MAG TPA: PIN domain-containing protein [Sphingobacteriaceae bacterium]|nr:PIN domain-containing protein [Sphingobacteriaceae bacterium]